METGTPFSTKHTVYGCHVRRTARRVVKKGGAGAVFRDCSVMAARLLREQEEPFESDSSDVAVV